MRGIAASMAGVFAALLAGAASAQDRTQTIPDAPAAEPPASALPWLKLEALSATRERPLFAPDRRPPRLAPPPDPQPMAEAAPMPEEPRPVPPALKGIIVQGASTLVLLEDQSTSDSVVVRSGDRFGPWQVTAESDRSVRLAADGEQVVLRLDGADADAETEPDRFQ